MLSGIYKIINTKNGKFYLGSAKNLQKRWRRHLNALGKNIHENLHLQRAFNKYGREFFEFQVVENCEISELLIREQYYLDLLTPWDITIGYNIGKNSSGGDNISNHPEIDRIRQRKSEIGKENWTKPAYREKQLKRLAGSGNPNWKGGISSRFCIECNTPITYGRERCKSCSKIGKNNNFFGKTHSLETKERLRVGRLGKKPTNTKQVSINGTVFLSAADAAKELGVCAATITWRVKSKNPKFQNYLYI